VKRIKTKHRHAKIDELRARKRKPRQAFDVPAHRDLIATRDAAWEADTGPPPALEAAPVSKRILARVG
jgi:hypothetical protein